MSTKVEKYKKIRESKIKKYGNCDTILIKKFLGKDSVFLLQNMFPVIEKYVAHSHVVKGKETKVVTQIAVEIERGFNKIMRLIKLGKKVIFTDIERDIEIMETELDKKK